jgi:hypothetical protein
MKTNPSSTFSQQLVRELGHTSLKGSASDQPF